jgi:predicted nucleic acid-binding protein
VGLRDAIGDGPVAIDSAIFIYFIEENRAYLECVIPLFDAADAGEFDIVTSALTLLEVLAAPYRVANMSLADRYEALLTRSRGIVLVDIDRGQLRAAAQLRAAYGPRTPDALQLAAALSRQCSAFVTNDRRMPKVPGLPVVQLADHL